MKGRKRILLLAVIMVSTCLLAVGTTIMLLYRQEMELQRNRLKTVVESQTHLIEAVTRFDARWIDHYPQGPSAATLGQILDAHERYGGFVKTGEFVLARREGDSIIFLLRSRSDDQGSAQRIPFDSALAEPMRRALGNTSGTLIGPDYRGVTVLAAFEPIEELNLGIVAKIDLQEIRAPFYRASLIALGVTMVLVTISLLLFRRVGDPIISRLETYSQQLETQIAQRRKAEERLLHYSETLEETVEARTQELRDTQESLVRKEKLAMLGQLAGGVGHELRNPLGVISNAVYFLRMLLPESEAKVREYLGIISTEVENSERIVSELLDSSRTKPQDRERVSVSSMVHGVLESQSTPAAVDVTTEVPATLSPVYVDVRQMERVLGNLLTNACHAMPDGGRLTIRAEEHHERIHISFADTGCGISEDLQKKIFEPLFTTKVRGIGLGLSVCKQLVEINGGHIEASSQEGQGSLFTITLPAEAELS